MEEIDIQILNELQKNYPLHERPYEVIAQNLEISEEELWNRIQLMLNNGIIRRIGASINSKEFGFSSTLAAVRVQSDQIQKASEVIGQFSEVTHSYLRNDDYNIWFTVIAADSTKIEDILKQIRTLLSLEDSDILNLPMKRLFKLDARFNV